HQFADRFLESSLARGPDTTPGTDPRTGAAMMIEVQFFARARDLVGASRVSVELPEAATVGALRRRLAELHPNLARLLERSALAVADEFAGNALILSPGAEVA